MSSEPAMKSHRKNQKDEQIGSLKVKDDPEAKTRKPKCCPACEFLGLHKQGRSEAWTKGYCKMCARSFFIEPEHSRTRKHVKKHSSLKNNNESNCTSKMKSWTICVYYSLLPSFKLFLYID